MFANMWRKLGRARGAWARNAWTQARKPKRERLLRLEALEARQLLALIISEFRVRGPSGANDEFVEIYNNADSDLTVAGGGTGFAVAASDGVARFTIPNGTIISRLAAITSE